MGRLFDIESPIMQWLQKIATIIFCGFFWLVCCIPVITVGASTTAMFRMMFNIREERSTRSGEFFRIFVKEFGKSTVIWLIQLASAVLLAVLFEQLLRVNASTVMQFVSAALFSLLLIGWAFTFSFAYPLTAYFENTILKTLSNGLLMATANRFQSIPILALTMLPFLIAFGTYLISYELFYYVILYLLPIWLVVIIPLLVYAQSGLYLKIFERYIVEPENTAKSAAEEISAASAEPFSANVLSEKETAASKTASAENSVSEHLK